MTDDTMRAGGRADAAINALTDGQEQADMHGERVKVSRQALDEVLAYLATTDTETAAPVVPASPIGERTRAVEQAAREVVTNAQRSYRSRGKDRYIEDESGEKMMLVPHEDWYRLDKALAALATPRPDDRQTLGAFGNLWDKACRETDRLSCDLDISNADHIVLWLENQLNGHVGPLAYIACRILDAHEAVLAGTQRVTSETDDRQTTVEPDAVEINSGGRAKTLKSATADDTTPLQAMEPDNPVEQALLDDADTTLADFSPGDPGKHLQTLIPTPEWKAFTKAAQARGASISLMLRIAARQHLAWLASYRSPAEIAALKQPDTGEGGR